MLNKQQGEAVVIGIVNQKGGVGKTTTAAHLGYYLASKGKRVLLIDTDAQGNLGSVLGISDIQERRCLHTFVVGRLPLEDVVAHSREGMCLDVVTSNKRTKEIESFVTAQVVSEVTSGKLTTISSLILHRAFEPYKKYYDVFIVDAPPTLNLMQTNVVAMADKIIVPTRLAYLSVVGVVDVLNTISDIAAQPGMDPPDLIGVLPFQYNVNMYNENRFMLGEIIRILQEAGGNAHLVLPPIPTNVRAETASRAGLTVFEYEPQAACVVGYKNGGSGTNSLGMTGGYLHLGEIVDGLLS